MSLINIISPFSSAMGVLCFIFNSNSWFLFIDQKGQESTSKYAFFKNRFSKKKISNPDSLDQTLSKIEKLPEIRSAESLTRFIEKGSVTNTGRFYSPPSWVLFRWNICKHDDTTPTFLLASRLLKMFKNVKFLAIK